MVRSRQLEGDFKDLQKKAIQEAKKSSKLLNGKSLDNLNEIEFEGIAYPVLFLPFVSRASEIIGKRIHLKIDENNFLLCFNNLIYSNNVISNIIDNCKNVDLKFIENQDSFTENEWKELYQLSENTFLEETDSLKQTAAGAGLSDND